MDWRSPTFPFACLCLYPALALPFALPAWPPVGLPPACLPLPLLQAACPPSLATPMCLCLAPTTAGPSPCVPPSYLAPPSSLPPFPFCGVDSLDSPACVCLPAFVFWLPICLCLPYPCLPSHPYPPCGLPAYLCPYLIYLHCVLLLVYMCTLPSVFICISPYLVLLGMDALALAYLFSFFNGVPAPPSVLTTLPSSYLLPPTITGSV